MCVHPSPFDEGQLESRSRSKFASELFHFPSHWIPFHSMSSLSLSLSPLPVLAKECANISSPALLAITSSLQRPPADIRPIAIYVSCHFKHSISPSRPYLRRHEILTFRSWSHHWWWQSKPPISLGMSNLNLPHTSQEPPPTHTLGCLGTSLIGHFPGAQCCRPVQ